MEEAIAEMGVREDDLDGIVIMNAKESEHNDMYLNMLYARLQRRGALLRDCQRMVNQDRNVFAACMVDAGHGDAMVTGLTRAYHTALDDVRKVIAPRSGELVFAVTLLIGRGRTLFVADTAVAERPAPADLAQMARQTAILARSMGHEPRVAFVSYSNFGNPPGGIAEGVREAVGILDQEGADFEYDGEMGVETALVAKRAQLYPFSRLSAPANILVMPGLHAANISTKLVGTYGVSTNIGPILMGLSKPVQIVSMTSGVSDVVQMALMAAHGAMKTDTLL